MFSKKTIIAILAGLVTFLLVLAIYYWLARRSTGKDEDKLMLVDEEEATEIQELVEETEDLKVEQKVRQDFHDVVLSLETEN